MTLEQIRKRGADVSARLAALAAIVQREGRTLSPTEIAEYTSLEAEFDTLQEDERAAALQLPAIPRGAAAPRGISADHAESLNLVPAQRRSASFGAPAVLTRTTQAQRNGDAFEGQSFARINLASLRATLNIAKGIRETPEGILATLYPKRPELAHFAANQTRRMAAGVEGGATVTGEAGSELLRNEQYVGDFVSYLHGQTLFDRMGFNEVPADITVKSQDGAFGGGFVGEKKPIPVSIGSYSAVTLPRLKAAGLTYLSRDLIERSAPAAEKLFRDGVTAALVKAVDSLAFSTTAASANVAPAGLLNGITGQASAGGGIANLFTDLRYLAGIFLAAKNSGGLKFVSDKLVASGMSHLMNGFTGEPLFKGAITEDGGVLQGKPYLTGDNVVAGNLLLIKPSDIWVVGDSGVRVELSTSATIEADTAPTGEGSGPTAQSANMVSMFQTDMVAIRAIRDVNWAYRRTSTIVTARITAADYNGVEATD